MSDAQHMRLALNLARRGYGITSPNPMVGAILVRQGKIIGRGWHRIAGGPHAEIEAIHDAQNRGTNVKGSTLYVTLEPCCTQGRTPPCTDAIVNAGIKRVVIGATDPNPQHSGKGFKLLKRSGIGVAHGILAEPCTALNEAFNHWIVHRTPFVTVKAAMTLDGKIATVTGESKWITSATARAHGMKLRQGADAILVGVNTILADDPRLTVRGNQRDQRGLNAIKQPRRIVLDSMARTPLKARIVSDEQAALTTIVVSKLAPRKRVAALAQRVNVLIAPLSKSRTANHQSKIALPWLLKKLGQEAVTNLLVEGGGEVNASFLLGGFAHRIAFFYAPKILGGHDSKKAVAGEGAKSLSDILELKEIEFKRLGPDLLLTARVVS